MIPRKRAGKKFLICAKRMRLDQLYWCGQCVFSCRLRTGTRHPGLKSKFPISDSLTDNFLGYATLWFPLLGSVKPLHMKSSLLETGIKSKDCQCTSLLVVL